VDCEAVVSRPGVLDHQLDCHIFDAAGCTCGIAPWHALTSTEAKLAAYLLREAASVFSNHGCNDVDLEALGLTADEQREIDRAYHAWNGDPDEHEGRTSYRFGTDFALMAYLAAKLVGRSRP
jgi:hypothetical protein